MLCVGVEVDVAAQLVVHAAALRVEAAVCAALHVREALRGRQPEDAALLATVRWSHDNRDSLLQHRLVAALRVDVDTAEEACLQTLKGTTQAIWSDDRMHAWLQDSCSWLLRLSAYHPHSTYRGKIDTPTLHTANAAPCPMPFAAAYLCRVRVNPPQGHQLPGRLHLPHLLLTKHLHSVTGASLQVQQTR